MILSKWNSTIIIGSHLNSFEELLWLSIAMSIDPLMHFHLSFRLLLLRHLQWILLYREERAWLVSRWYSFLSCTSITILQVIWEERWFRLFLPILLKQNWSKFSLCFRLFRMMNKSTNSWQLVNLILFKLDYIIFWSGILFLSSLDGWLLLT